MYEPVKPSFLGKRVIDPVDFMLIAPYINWTYFFTAWKLTGNYDDLSTLCDCEACKTKWLLKYTPKEREKAQEAYTLFRDAQDILRKGISEKRFRISALVYFCEACGKEEGILLKTNNAGDVYFPMLRQQHPSERNGLCLSLSDFISPKKDYVGLFAVTVHGGDEWADEEKDKGDDYTSLLIKSVADRLAEASAEWLHHEIRRKYWGYGNILQSQGIRPAFGYPSIPDLSMLFEADKLLHLEDIGISISENGAMKPNASICAMHISHPQAFYFMVGEIGIDQKEAYAKQRGMTTQELSRWLSTSCG